MQKVFNINQWRLVAGVGIVGKRSRKSLLSNFS